MGDWHESEAKAECLDLRVRVAEQDAEIEQLRAANAGEGFPHYGVCGEEAHTLRAEVEQLKADLQHRIDAEMMGRDS